VVISVLLVRDVVAALAIIACSGHRRARGDCCVRGRRCARLVAALVVVVVAIALAVVVALPVIGLALAKSTPHSR
jgi:hypothetical protein